MSSSGFNGPRKQRGWIHWWLAAARIANGELVLLKEASDVERKDDEASETPEDEEPTEGSCRLH